MLSKTPEPEFTLAPLSPVRKAIARRVSDSMREIPQFHLHVEADAAALVSARRRFKESPGGRAPGYNDMILHCVSRALPGHPGLNAHFSEQGIKLFREVNVGFAVSAAGGVLVPVIRQADQKSLQAIADEAGERAALARAGKLRASWQMFGTFSVSSLGALPVDSFNAIISPPQVAILAAGAIVKKPVLKDGLVVAGETLHLTLTVDHRAVDGAMAAAFLCDLRKRLEIFSGD
jgi:pyruvate dehydrogenase E2 component (dihydrolipoamide acetyltransferase)